MLVAWDSGRTSVCDRPANFPCSSCSWRVTTYVGKSSATRSANKVNSAFHPLEVDQWVVSCNLMCTASLGIRELEPNTTLPFQEPEQNRTSVVKVFPISSLNSGYAYHRRLFVTGPPTHSVRGQTSTGRWRLPSSVVCRRICNVTHQGAACDGGPVVLLLVSATPCVALWLSSMALDLRFTGRGFNSRPVAFT